MIPLFYLRMQRNVSISLESISAKEMLKRMSMGDCLFAPHKKTVGKRKTASAAKPRAKKAETISYELRLHLNLMDREAAADVYAKTKDHYQELKDLLPVEKAE